LHPVTLSNWQAGKGPDLDGLDQFTRALALRVSLSLDATKEAPRPEWAEGLETRIAEAVAMRLGELD